MQGRIIKVISNDYTVKCNNEEYICKALGKFRYLKITPLAGDIVEINPELKTITNILPRKNELLRPPVSNIDKAIIITSLARPAFDSNLLDKLLALIIWNNITPIIIFTKIDLVDINDFKDIINYYKKICEVYLNTDVENIKKIFKGKISVFAGQSGAGKSTLLNKINSHLNLKTGEISLALNRGKHTTRHIELLDIEGGLVADTPGFSSLEFTNMTLEDIKDTFPEFNKYRNLCKYRDCMHDKEKDCEIKRQVESGNILKSRYENYLNFIHKR